MTQKKLAQQIIKNLKVQYVSFPIARTVKGDLAIKYTEDSQEITLDSVPLNLGDFNQKELDTLLNKFYSAEE